MTTEQLIENYTPAIDMISVITCGVLWFIIAKTLYFTKDRKFTFLKRSLSFILLGACCNIGFYLAISQYNASFGVIIILRNMYHFFFMCCLYCYMLYMKKMLDVKGRLQMGVSHFTRILFCVCAALEMSSPNTKMGLYRENNLWHDSIFSPYNAFYIYSVFILFVLLMMYSSRLIRSVRECLIITEFVVLCVMAYQGFLNINAFTSFTYVLPLLVVLILIHSRPFDDKTGSLSASSFKGFVKQTKQKGVSVDYMVLKLYMGMLDQMPDELGKVLNSFWHDAFKNAVLFDLSSNLYVLAIPRTNKNGNTVEKMQKIINTNFPKYYSQYNYPYKMIQLCDVDFVENETDIMGIIKYLLEIMDENSLYVVDEKKKEELKLYKAIKENLADVEKTNNLDDPRVIVYCQPIRNMATGEFDTAEALMRLQLPEAGFVMPGMFIQIAEQYKNIHALTKIMLNKVCRNIRKLTEEGYNFKRISVNFAASEIKADSFCDEILNIIKENGISPSKIGIELTESQNESDFRIVKEKIRILKDAGMTLYLDDVGTGYSNMDRIVKYDVDIVKFDRFFLLEAEKSAKIVKMLSHLSDAFRDLDYKLLYEGVENNQHEELCMSCGADYIQGFKYSKPVPMEELVNYFNKN